MEHELLTVKEVAATLRLSRSATYQLLARSDLPRLRIGRTFRIPRAALEAWLRLQLEPGEAL
jgi:excisionase family DNA binding protein